MIQNLPREVIIQILKYIDPKGTSKRYPEYVFRQRLQLLIPLSQTSRSLRSTVLPLLIKELSLVRKHELQIVPRVYNPQYTQLIVATLKGYESFVEQLELHSESLYLLKYYQDIKSLTILGDTNDSAIFSFQDKITLEHIAMALPKHNTNPSDFQQLKRLDLLITTDFYTTALSTFSRCPLKELNITTQGPITLITWKLFIEFLGNFNDLKHLSLRKRGTRPSQNISDQETLPLVEFFKCLPSNSLETFSIDIIFLRAYAPKIIDCNDDLSTSQINEKRNSLHITLIEPSLAGPLTSYQKDIVLSFLNILSYSFKLKSLKYAYGLQTELPTNTPILIFQDLITMIYLNNENKYESLKSFETVYSIMAWNIRDDNEHYHQQLLHPYDLLSHDTDGRFSPNYQKLLQYDIKVSQTTRGIYLLSHFLDENHSKDYKFWSSETISKDLIKYFPKERSSLWD